jgi:hypothetical protein
MSVSKKNPERGWGRIILGSFLVATIILNVFQQLVGFPYYVLPAYASISQEETRQILEWSNQDRRIGQGPQVFRCRQLLEGYISLLVRSSTTSSFDAKQMLNREVENIGVRFLEEGCSPGMLLAARFMILERVGG